MLLDEPAEILQEPLLAAEERLDGGAVGDIGRRPNRISGSTPTPVPPIL